MSQLILSPIVGMTAVSKEIEKTMLMQNFGGQTRCIMGNVEVAYVITKGTGIH